MLKKMALLTIKSRRPFCRFTGRKAPLRLPTVILKMQTPVGWSASAHPGLPASRRRRTQCQNLTQLF